MFNKSVSHKYVYVFKIVIFRWYYFKLSRKGPDARMYMHLRCTDLQHKTNVRSEESILTLCVVGFNITVNLSIIKISNLKVRILLFVFPLKLYSLF